MKKEENEIIKNLKKNKILPVVINWIVIIAVLVICVVTFFERNNFWITLCISSLIASALVIVVCCFKIYKIKEQIKMEEDKKYQPYNFHYQTEYYIYTHIGRNYVAKEKKKKRKMIDESMLSIVYSDWKNKFKTRFEHENKVDLARYLNRILRIQCDWIEIFKTILIPIELGYATKMFAMGNESEQIIMNVIGMIFCIAFFSINLYYSRHEMYFLQDVIEIIDEEIEKEKC